MSDTQYITQTGGTKLHYTLSSYPTTCQITVGGRMTGSCKITYRPYLPGKELVEASDYESPIDNVIDFSLQSNGVIKHTFVLKDLRMSKIAIDDSGNTGDFWVQIVQY
jgi:hypothetical protein